MKTMVQNYTFNPATRQVTIMDYACLKIENILLITNMVSNKIIYSFADPLLGGIISDNNVLTLIFDPASVDMLGSDSLQIFVDLPVPENVNELYPLSEQYTYDTNMERVLGSTPLYDDGKLKTKTSMMKLGEAKGVLSALNHEISIDCEGAQTIALQVAGTWAGTLTFETRVSDGDYMGIVGLAPISVLYMTSTTTNVVLQFNVAGYRRFRVRFSAYTSGSAIIWLTSTSALSRLVNADGTIGSQGQLIVQRPTTYELSTYDTNLVNVFGGAKLWRDGFYTTDFPIAPTINPTQPTTYTDNKYARFPQTVPRLKVEIGGSEKLPFAQEANTNKLMVSDDIQRRLLEEILVQMQIMNQNSAIVYNLDIIQGQNEW